MSESPHIDLTTMQSNYKENKWDLGLVLWWHAWLWRSISGGDLMVI